MRSTTGPTRTKPSPPSSTTPWKMANPRRLPGRLPGRFGEEVGRIVEGCTDADTRPKPPWRERKEAYIARIAAEDRSVLLVSASDKLHNARSIVRDLREIGDPLWDRFSAPKDETLWYYRSLVTAYRGNAAYNEALVGELDRTVTEMEALARGRPA